MAKYNEDVQQDIRDLRELRQLAGALPNKGDKVLLPRDETTGEVQYGNINDVALSDGKGGILWSNNYYNKAETETKIREIIGMAIQQEY